jgi:hypothetical protein
MGLEMEMDTAAPERVERDWKRKDGCTALQEGKGTEKEK